MFVNFSADYILFVLVSNYGDQKQVLIVPLWTSMMTDILYVK